jgi:hypothetical protein
MANNASLKDFEPFFGGDKKGATLVQALFQGTNFSARWNSGILAELLRADNYKNFQNNRSGVGGISQGPEDVHQDVTDLVINTALYHREIDKSTTAGTNTGIVLDRIRNALKSYLDTDLSALKHGSERPYLNSRLVTGKTEWVGNTYKKQIRNNTGLELVYGLADLAVRDLADTIEKKESISQLSNYSHTFSDGSKLSATDAINALVDCGKTFDNLCWSSVLYPTASSNLPNAGDALNDLEANTGKTGLAKSIVNTVQDSLRRLLIDVVVKIKESVHNSGKYKELDRVTASNKIGQASPVTVIDFLSEDNDKNYLDMLKAGVDAVVMEGIRKALPTQNLPYTTLSSAEAVEFFNKVYKKWPTMTNDVRSFYRQNISLFAKSGTNLYEPRTQNRDQPFQSGWMRLTEAEINKLFESGRVNAFTPADLSNLRVNLMKSPLNYKEVLFGSNLPDIPDGSNVWYTTNNRTLKHVPAASIDFLRQLYDAVYSDGVQNGSVTVDTTEARMASRIGARVQSAEDIKRLAAEKASREKAEEARIKEALKGELGGLTSQIKGIGSAQGADKQELLNKLADLERQIKLLTPPSSSSSFSSSSLSSSSSSSPTSTTSPQLAKPTTSTSQLDLLSEFDPLTTNTTQSGGRYMHRGGGGYVLTDLETDLAKRPKEAFSLNHGKFLAAAIAREDEFVRAQEQTATPSPTFGPDDLGKYPVLTAYDMVYGQLWTFDSQKQMYYRNGPDGRRIYYDDVAQGDAATCYATYLGNKSVEKCDRVINCIADGNSKSLSRCLGLLGETDLWKVAAEDAQKVGPDKVKLVLRKFGVPAEEKTDSNGVKYKVPISYDEWVREVVNKEFEPNVRQTIMQNENLKTYLKGLIGICRSNLSILNRHNPSIVARDNTPDYIKNLAMRKYKIPSVNKKTQYEFFADALRNAMMPVGVSQSWFNPITSGQLSNVSFFNPMTTGAPALFGGNPFGVITPSLPTAGTGFSGLDRQGQIIKDGSSTQFQSLLATINSAFTDVGLQLHPDDKAKITAVINKMDEYENQLARMYSVLINIVKVARFYGVSLEQVDRDHPTTVELSQLATIDDITRFIRKYVKDLTRNMLTNMTVQQAVAYELMNKVGPRVIDECVGKESETPTTAPQKKWVPI